MTEETDLGVLDQELYMHWAGTVVTLVASKAEGGIVNQTLAP